MLLYCIQDTTLILSVRCQQHGALQVLYNQRRHFYSPVSIYAVFYYQVIQQLEQRPIQGDHKVIISWVILRSARGWERGWIHACLWRLSIPPLTTGKTHIRSTTKIERRLVLMKQKGVYPYLYRDSFESFQESQLPPKDTFYSSLTEEDISDRLHPHSKGYQPLRYFRTQRSSQLLSVNWRAFTYWRVQEF